MKYLKLFNVVIQSNLSFSTYNLFKKHFMTELSMGSIFALHAQISKLSHVTEQSCDCCINSCCCYTGSYTRLNVCPFCNHPWYDSQGRSYKVYKYLPVEPHVKSLYLSSCYSETLCYQSHLRSRDSPKEIGDVFDGQHYQTLLLMQVKINGVDQGHHFFSNPQDIALGVMLDGFQIFKVQRDRGTTCWPIIAVNFNLPPEI